ncbi:tRNA (guanosine(37)-N1)-methyltransferase TrmD [Candidatus Curtissbacteria bacterium RIFCSPLOWO2_01_FULL_42_26]|uniref:tRNA (guanine-N(1)-)-methyltransferase n=1 Tax=Candidatus Curtissbacteria bacterium RIFCSPLOWO2_01_FULL_42_26 TaxID=1797729 RepID=A0A1F5HXK8_9BACT|nr:MAG: tRNA (guanosine(37)-N1)-methyltransferase TrmD [Candidatus Curtissbacteria bacterium RIFCSPLOWO2_01_FULL_42_26]
MTINILTLFPEIFGTVFSKSIIARAIDKKLLSIKLINIRSWGLGKRKTVDDKPYGGGKGMVMMAEPILTALDSIKPKPYIVLLCASGRKFNQHKARFFAKKKNLALICGHYEGIDVRVEKYVDEIISIGDFILTGGEIPAMVIVDSVTRFIPGSINPESSVDESFEKGHLEYPQYTQPQIYRGIKVPSVLLSGNHYQIAAWQKAQAVKRTKKFRPDLLGKRKVS